MIELTIPGDPKGKARPRLGRSGHTYTPRDTREYEDLVKTEYFKQSSAMWFYPNGAVGINITAYFRIPGSASKQRRDRIAHGDELPTKKPDADNIAKIVMDALNGLAYEDDKQVAFLAVEKRYAGEGTLPRVEVTVYPL